MSQSMLDSINLRHGVRRKHVYGGIGGTNFNTTRSNQGVLTGLKNSINTVSYSNAFMTDAGLTRKELT